jgi:tRNA(fMet)-specific endonuclease VapC
LEPFEIVPFDTLCAEWYADIRENLERRGQVIGPNDLLIAATTLAHHGTLVTHNTREFRRIARLTLEDWTSTAPP